MLITQNAVVSYKIWYWSILIYMKWAPSRCTELFLYYNELNSELIGTYKSAIQNNLFNGLLYWLYSWNRLAILVLNHIRDQTVCEIKHLLKISITIHTAKIIFNVSKIFSIFLHNSRMYEYQMSLYEKKCISVFTKMLNNNENIMFINMSLYWQL